MIFSAFQSLLIHCIFSFLLILSCGGIVALVQGSDAAIRLIEVAIYDMKGPWVWTLGVGLVRFIRKKGLICANSLRAILSDTQATAIAIARIEHSIKHRSALLFTVPITIMGFALTYAYGVPSSGLASIMLTLGILAIYYAAAYLLFHFYNLIAAFNSIYLVIDNVNFKDIFSPLHLENIVNYLSITTVLGIGGIYMGFRGTLTAGFEFHEPMWRYFLITPLILFLPATLFYNFYPRYVLRKVVQHKVFNLMNKIANASIADAKALLMEVKEAGAVHSQILPFIDYKSMPSYLISIVFMLSFIYNTDSEIKELIKSLLGLEGS